MLAETTNLKIEELNRLFLALSEKEQEEIFNFIHYLFFKKEEITNGDTEAKKELLKRKEAALIEMQKGELFEEEKVYQEIEASLGI